MQSAKLSAGDPIEARCTKCRKITNHTIVAMTADLPAKVECNTCRGQHKFRPAAPVKKTVRRAADPKVAEQKEWQALSLAAKAEQATDYSMTTAFKTGTLMKHPAFGLGLVQGTAGPRKIKVLFEDGMKTMRCK